MTLSKHNFFPYDPKLRARARDLRKNGTRGEALLWMEIRGKSLGWEFHRQVPVLTYIVDFYCHEQRLAIEIDGRSHDGDSAFRYDEQREDALRELGIRVLRFNESQVQRDVRSVVDAIMDWLQHEA